MRRWIENVLIVIDVIIISILAIALVPMAAQMILFWLIALAPACMYPAICWAYWLVIAHKKSVVERLLRGTTTSHGALKAQYLKLFPIAERPSPVKPKKPETNADPTDGLFAATYNRNTFILAVFLCWFWAVVGAATCLVKIRLPLGLPSDIVRIVGEAPAAMFAGMIGAYVWGMYDILRRYHLADLSTVSLHFVWLRLLIATSLGYLADAAFKETGSLIAAFALGAFPIGSLMDFVKAQAKTKYGIGAGDQPGEAATLANLQGLTTDVIERLRDEGIDSAARLAYTDPIQLLLRTNFEWKVILDMLDQAALFNYVGSKIAALRPLGIRGANEMADAWQDVKKEIAAAGDHSSKLLTAIAAKLDDQQGDSTRNLMLTLSEDPHFEFLRTLWSDANPG